MYTLPPPFFLFPLSNTRKRPSSYTPRMKRHTVRTRAKMGGVTIFSKRMPLPPLPPLPPRLTKWNASSFRVPKELKLKKSERDDIKDLLNIIQSKNWSSLPTYFGRFDDAQIQLLCESLNLHKLTKRNREDQVRGLIKKIKTGGRGPFTYLMWYFKWMLRASAGICTVETADKLRTAVDSKRLKNEHEEVSEIQGRGKKISEPGVKRELLKQSGIYGLSTICNLLVSEKLLPKLESWIKNKNQQATLRKLQTEIQSFKR